MRKLENIFASTRLAFYLIGILVLLIMISALVPQKGIAEDRILDWETTLGTGYQVVEKLGLDRIYFTPYFFVVLGLLGLNLIVGNVKRFRIVYRVERTLLRARHVGSIVFHLALVLVICSVILNYLYKFQGVYGLTEGQTALDHPEEYFRIMAGPLHATEYDRFEIQLDEVEPRHDVEGIPTPAAHIKVSSSLLPDPVEGTVRINQPLRLRDMEFHLGSKLGYSPELCIKDSTGTRLFKGFVRLATQMENGAPVYRDFVFLPERNMKVGIEIKPGKAGGSEPLRLITLEEKGKTLYQGLLPHGEAVQVAGLSVEIPRMREWCYIEVVRSPHLNLVFASFWLGLGGMAVGFVPRVLDRRNRRS